MLEHPLSLPLGGKGSKRAPGGYRSRGEWFHKSRRLAVLQHRLAVVATDREAGVVHIVRGITPGGEVSIKLPAPLADLANSEHGRYVLASKIAFQHRGREWRDRIEANRAVAYRIHHEVERGRWYLTASWIKSIVASVPLGAARAQGMVGIDTNADHLAAYRLDRHGNPVGDPRRFPYDLSGSADHRDAQIRHALTRLLHWTKQSGAAAIGIENLDFPADKTREKHGRKKRFRQLISGMPTGKLKARIISDDQSDRRGHRTIQADRGTQEREGTHHPVTERAPDALPRTGETRTRATSASNTVRDARSAGMWVQDSLLLTDEERLGLSEDQG